jgi:phage baseplate assembly protein W
MPANPHFSLPFRFERLADGTQRTAVTEQDTALEIGDAVELTLRTIQGERATLPGFGRPESLLFTLDRDLARSMVQEAIDDAEPRVRALVEAAPIDTQDPGLLRLIALYDIGEGER